MFLLELLFANSAHLRFKRNSAGLTDKNVVCQPSSWVTQLCAPPTWTLHVINVLIDKRIFVKRGLSETGCTLVADQMLCWPYQVYSSVHFCLSPASQPVSQHPSSPSQAWRRLSAAHVVAPRRWLARTELTGCFAEPRRDWPHADAEPAREVTDHTQGHGTGTAAVYPHHHQMVLSLTSWLLLNSASSSSRLSSLWCSSLCRLSTRSVRAATFLFASANDSRASSVCSLWTHINTHVTNHLFLALSTAVKLTLFLTCRRRFSCSDILDVFCKAARRLCVLLWVAATSWRLWLRDVAFSLSADSLSYALSRAWLSLSTSLWSWDTRASPSATCFSRLSWRSWVAWLSVCRSPRLSLNLFSSPSRLRLPTSTLVARASAASSASRRRLLSASRRISAARCLFSCSCGDGGRTET